MKFVLLLTAFFASTASALRTTSHKLESSNLREAPKAPEASLNEANAPVNNFNFDDSVACKNSGGRYRKQGIVGAYACVKGYKDAFKPCKTSDDCQGDCIVETTKDPVAYCQPSDSKFGCWNTIEKVKGGEPIICRD